MYIRSHNPKVCNLKFMLTNVLLVLHVHKYIWQMYHLASKSVPFHFLYLLQYNMQYYMNTMKNNKYHTVRPFQILMENSQKWAKLLSLTLKYMNAEFPGLLQTR